MTTQQISPTNGHFARSGALAGAVSVLAFATVHDWLISDIWSMALIMLVAGALCGALVGWSYGRLVPEPSLGSWLGYNLLYLLMFLLLTVVSILVFEPVTTIAELSANLGPLNQLIVQALPMSAVFTLVMAAAITLTYGWGWTRFGAVLLTSSVLVVLLGHNLSFLGLIAIPRGSLYLIAEFFGLILVINGVFLLVFSALEHKRLRQAATVRNSLA